MRLKSLLPSGELVCTTATESHGALEPVCSVGLAVPLQSWGVGVFVHRRPSVLGGELLPEAQAQRLHFVKVTQLGVAGPQPNQAAPLPGLSVGGLSQTCVQ